MGSLTVFATHVTIRIFVWVNMDECESYENRTIRHFVELCVSFENRALHVLLIFLLMEIANFQVSLLPMFTVFLHLTHSFPEFDTNDVLLFSFSSENLSFMVRLIFCLFLSDPF